MPQKNTIKQYVENGFYHIYNRGVNKRAIFNDEQDYSVFLNYLKATLTPPDSKDNTPRKITVNVKGVSFDRSVKPPKNHHGKVELITYCLMPNHFHFLIKQNAKNEMESLMRSILTRYSMYFNKRYDRIGPLFQGTYKAVFINNENYLLHLSRYIHLNPSENHKDLTLAHSSYANYLGKKHTPWVKPDIILGYFNNQNIPGIKNLNNYQDFVENYDRDSREILEELVLE